MSLKVLTIVDKEGTALDRLAKGVAKYHTNLNYVVVDFHPKRPSQEQITELLKHLDADIIDAQYFRSIEKIRELIPAFANIPTILTHNNPYSIEEQDWNGYQMSVGNNEYIYKRLGEITTQPVEYIPLTVDTDQWIFNPDWTPNKNVLMVANRIESKKGILPVAKACADLNLHFILVGAISDPNYFHEIRQASQNLEFHEQIPDNKLRDLYHKSTLHVCNSVDKFESGTLPILEAMLCGTPVVTRKVGHVPDLDNGSNMFINDGEPEDVENLKTVLLDAISDKKKLADVRDKAWQTAKTRSFERRAYEYQKLYRQVLHDTTPVSVVVPVYDKPEIISRCLEAVAQQTYKNIELIVCDDSLQGESQSLVMEFAKYVTFPVRYLNTAEVTIGTSEYTKDYGLARARNEATIEATGEIMVYCDQRNVMNPDCVETFVKYTKPKVWLFGNKGADKDSFVENLSCIKREDIINMGLFSERMIWYGGLSQESRNRFKNQGGRTEFVKTASAVAVGKSSNRNRKRAEIIKAKNRLAKMGL